MSRLKRKMGSCGDISSVNGFEAAKTVLKYLTVRKFRRYTVLNPLDDLDNLDWQINPTPSHEAK